MTPSYDFEQASLPEMTTAAPVPPPAGASMWGMPSPQEPRTVPGSKTAYAGDPGVPTPPAIPEDTATPNWDYFQASRVASQYDGIAAGEHNAVVDATAKRIDAIKTATGADVLNPFNASPMTGTELDDPNAHPQDKAALQAYAAAHPDYQPGQLIDARGQMELQNYRVSAFQSALDDLAQKHPDQANIIAANRPILADAKQLTQDALAKAETTGKAAIGLTSYLAGFGGQMVGSFRDPIQVAALAAGPGEFAAIKALPYVGPILARMVGDGLLNAGIAALGQPEVQAWRAERGKETGVLPAVQDVGMAALFGMGFGALAHGVSSGAKSVFGSVPQAKVDLVNKAMNGDMNAAREVATTLTPDHAPDLHAFIEADRLDTEATSGQPEHVAAGDIADTYRQALRRAEDPSEPLPVMPPVVDQRHTDTAVLDAIRRNPNDDPFDVIRSDPALIDSALVSDNPNLKAAGRVASMGDEAFDMVRNGGVDPAIAHEVAARVSDPAEQASILQRVVDDRPQSPEEAARLVSEEMDRRALPESLSRLLGVEKLSERPVQPLRPVHQSTAKPQTLLQFLRAAGGVKDPSGDLKSIGFGERGNKNWLVNNASGLHPDHAREIAAEAGYLGGDTEHAVGNTTISDLFDALGEPNRYSVHDAMQAVHAEAAAWDREHGQKAVMPRRSAEKLIREGVAVAEGDKLDPMILSRAAEHLMDGDEKDPVHAWDRAAFDFEREIVAHSNNTQEGHHGDPIPFFDDVHSDAGTTPGASGEFARGPGQESGMEGAPRGAGEQPRTDSGGDRTTEQTAAGEQRLIPGVEPVTDKQRAQLAADKPLRGGDEPAGGLFDTSARDQHDLLDMIPLDDGRGGMELKTREAVLNDEPRQSFLADLVSACKA